VPNLKLSNKKRKASIINSIGPEEKVMNEVKYQKEKEKILLIFPDLIVKVLHYFPWGNV
jgi:hypothetical protein